MFESEKMMEEGVEAAEGDQDPGPEAEEELGDLRHTRLPGRGAGVGEEAGTGAGADQEKGTGAASRDPETGPGPAHRRRRLADSPAKKKTSNYNHTTQTHY